MVHFDIQKGPGNPIIQQINDQIRNRILSGELKANEKLASTRDMASALNISRNTVTIAYETLVAEGYIISVPGSGFFVTEGAKFTKTLEKVWDYHVTPFSSRRLREDTIDFHSGTPALDLFPRQKWNRAVSHAFREAPVSAFGYDLPQGRPELRNTLVAYLKKSRGIQCNPDQIIVTTGVKQGLTLVAKCLLQPGSEAWIEDPSNKYVRQIFSYHTDRIIPIAVDSEGIRPELFPAGQCPALIFVTPSHQFPLGGILPIRRRLELIRYARKTGCYIVEDDYNCEFRYRGLPVSALQELDSERVIYAGTFSKTLFPSIRLGYMVLPDALIEPCKEWKRLGDHHTNSLNQLALMRFIESGEMERHIARMKKIYQKRRDALIAILNANFPGKVEISGEKAGMHIVAEFSEAVFTPDLIRKMEQAGVHTISVEEHSIIKGNHTQKIILGYSHLSQAEIAEGLARLKKALACE